MSVGRQFGLAATGGDPKLKLPLVAVPPLPVAALKGAVAPPKARETKIVGETKIGDITLAIPNRKR